MVRLDHTAWSASSQYPLDDIREIGEITAEVTTAQIKTARDRHRGMLGADLKHLQDLP
jgi:hypothetical protein